MTLGTRGTGQLLLSLFISPGYTAAIARCVCLQTPVSNLALQFLTEWRTLALQSALITVSEILYGGLPRVRGGGVGIRSP